MLIICFVVPPCYNIADIGFVVDSSGSLRRDFGKEKQFVKALADVIGIAPDGNRAGIVTFSYFAELTGKLSDSVAPDGFEAMVDKIPFMGYTTRIDRALKLVGKEMFKTSNGARAGVPKILFVLTDGTQTKDSDAVDPALIASELREKLGIRLIVIGIGRRVSPGELSRIAGSSSNLFMAKDFKQLKSADFITDVSSLFCRQGTYLHVYTLHYVLLSSDCTLPVYSCPKSKIVLQSSIN